MVLAYVSWSSIPKCADLCGINLLVALQHVEDTRLDGFLGETAGGREGRAGNEASGDGARCPSGTESGGPASKTEHYRVWIGDWRQRRVGVTENLPATSDAA